MSEVNKYLNRDGLEEYNSLLPHSSGEMQEYVNDWLDEHPEATTTVQDGAITEPKLADKSVSLRTLADDTVHMLKGMILTQEISGKVLTADDAYSAPPMAFTVEGKSTQDGTPTPDAPVEIVSLEQVNLKFAGANRMYLDASASGITVSDGVYEGSVINLNAAIRCIYPIPEGSALTFKFRSLQSTAGNMNVVGIRAVDGATRYLLSPPYTQTEWKTYTYIANSAYAQIKFLSNASGNLRCQIKDLCVRADGSTTYEPYNATNVLLNLTHALRSLPDGTHDTLSFAYLRPSTREGWAWYGREVTRRVSPIDLGGLKTIYGGANNNVFYKRWPDGSYGAAARVAIGAKGAICPPFAAEGATSLAAARSKPVNTIMLCQTGDTGVMVNVPTSDYPTVAAFTAAFTGIIAYYPLATPVTTTLDPIELPVLPAPTCTVWSDPSTGLQMEYVRDANIVIQNIEQAIADL